MRQVATFVPDDGGTSFSHRLHKNEGKVAAGAAARAIDYLNVRGPHAAICARPKLYAVAVINEVTGPYCFLSMPLSPQLQQIRMED